MILRLIPLLALLGLPAACTGKTRPFRVERVKPSAEGGPAPLFLNQEIAVYFTEPIDPMMITDDTVLVVDERGGPVPGRLQIGSRSVSFIPVPPVTPDLDDGSFEPGGIYKLIVYGVPKLGIRSTSGAVLERTEVRTFQAVQVAPSHQGFFSVFLPVGTGTEALSLQVGPDLPLRMAADTGKLQLHFNLPLLPASVTPDAFQFFRIVDNKSERIVPSDVRILPVRVPRTHFFGCTVEVGFPPELGIRTDDVLWLVLEDGEPALRDYRGRTVAVPEQPIHVLIDPGDRVKVTDFRETEFFAMPGHVLGFEVRGGRIFPQCRVEAGSGRLGWFRPEKPTILTPGVPFDRGDGTLVTSDGDFDFVGIEVPTGVTVTVRSTSRVRLRACQGIDLRGELRVETPVAQNGWERGATVTPAELLQSSFLCLIASGDIRIRGSVSHLTESAQGSPVTVLSGGDIVLQGRLPPQSLLAVAPDRKVRGRGVAERAIQLWATMTPGVPPGLELSAGAWTDWLDLPRLHSGSIELHADGVRGDIDLAAQISPDGKVLREPVALRDPDPSKHSGLREIGPLEVPQGALLRLRIRAAVRSGSLPSFGGFTVHER